MNVTSNLNKHILDNKGSGIGVILYGMTLLLILIFTAVNIVNSKVIENGYNSLRDAVHSASTGSVIHLLTSNSDTLTDAQKNVIQQASYDVYLQLALGYLINRNPTSTAKTNDRNVQDGELNNFIKLDHRKVVNSTLALFADAVSRNKNKVSSERYKEISNTDKYKILMFFIEPYADGNNQKYFDIICYSNEGWNGNVTSEYARTAVKLSKNSSGNMNTVYKNVQGEINQIVENFGDDNRNYNINLNATGGDLDGIVRKMQTYPHYLIVVKDFALPTIFDGVETGDKDGRDGVRRLFQSASTSLSGDGKLHTPMCALNTGKVQRQTEDKNWTKERWYSYPTKN